MTIEGCFIQIINIRCFSALCIFNEWLLFISSWRFFPLYLFLLLTYSIYMSIVSYRLLTSLYLNASYEFHPSHFFFIFKIFIVKSIANVSFFSPLTPSSLPLTHTPSLHHTFAYDHGLCIYANKFFGWSTSNVFLISVIVVLIYFLYSYLCFQSLEVLTEIIYSSLKLIVHSYNKCFELYIW